MLDCSRKHDKRRTEQCKNWANQDKLKNVKPEEGHGRKLQKRRSPKKPSP